MKFFNSGAMIAMSIFMLACGKPAQKSPIDTSQPIKSTSDTNSINAQSLCKLNKTGKMSQRIFSSAVNGNYAIAEKFDFCKVDEVECLIKAIGQMTQLIYVSKISDYSVPNAYDNCGDNLNCRVRKLGEMVEMIYWDNGLNLHKESDKFQACNKEDLNCLIDAIGTMTEVTYQIKINGSQSAITLTNVP